jgi:pimeloyl-ACP methyl ester carboxylesterase
MKIIGSLENMRDTPAVGKEKGVVIFVHGPWHGGWCWEQSFTSLFSRKGYRCITFDLPYHDRAGERPDIRKVRLRDYMLTLEHVIKRVGGNPILIGHSMGAYLIQKYLVKGKCRMAVLMSPPPPDKGWRTILRLMQKPYIWKAVLFGRMHLAVSTPKRASWALFGEGIRKEDTERYTGMMCDESREVLADMLWRDKAPKLPSDIPCIVFGGHRDRLFTLRDLDRTGTYLGCGIVVMADMGHDMMLEPGTDKLVDIMVNCIETKLGIPRSVRELKPLEPDSPIRERPILPFTDKKKRLN